MQQFIKNMPDWVPGQNLGQVSDLSHVNLLELCDRVSGGRRQRRARAKLRKKIVILVTSFELIFLDSSNMFRTKSLCCGLGHDLLRVLNSFEFLESGCIFIILLTVQIFI